MHNKTLSYIMGAIFAVSATSLPVYVMAQTNDVAADRSDGVVDTIIVTGARDPGRTARSSVSPIVVITADDLAATGQTTLLDALKNITPSLNSPAVGYDVGALARTFQLRGLSPAQTLVLINGKRRHLSASLYADSDPAQGSNAVDLDMIPLAAIDHIEILQDGAAAQYGSDAIAGVINVILKKDNKGFQASTLGGGYMDGGGATGQLDVAGGMKLGDDGALYLSSGLRHHGFSNRSGDSGGVQPALVQGDPRSDLSTFGFNLEKPLTGDTVFYSFGTVATRSAQAYENPRQPGAINSQVDALYPEGFTPKETLHENDYAATAGVKGQSADQWSWDLSATYGKDDEKLHNIHTVNPDLLNDFQNPQSSFYVGSFSSSEFTSNADVRRPFAVAGLFSPLNVALGLEDRYEMFGIGAGEPNSYYLGGSQAFPGFRTSDQVNAHRNSVAAYVDLLAHMTKEWEVGFATRAEHYDQIGDKVTGKLSSRYNFAPQFAVRGTISNGFHAPTLAQEYYSATNVTTGAAQIQLPLGSPGAALLGAPDLKPETSRNLSVGFVAEPIKGMHSSLDFYQIDIDKRIIESASLSGNLVAEAIAANGAAVPAGVSGANANAAFYTNGVNTRTRGVDFGSDYFTDLDELGSIVWHFNAGYNSTTIRSILAAPAVLQQAGLGLVDAVQESNLTTATPHIKSSLAASYQISSWDFTLRETYFGHTSQVQLGYPAPDYNQTNYIMTTQNAWITDLDVNYAINRHIKVTIGANNLFNTYPTKIAPAVYQAVSYDQYSHLSPFGVNGGYYYAKLSISY